MLKFVLLFACAAVMMAEQAEPVQTESQSEFFAPTSLQQLLSQGQLYRKMADIYLGLQISSNFYRLGQAEYAIGKIPDDAPYDRPIGPQINLEESDDVEPELEDDDGDSDNAVAEVDNEDSADQSLEEDGDDDDNSFIELKSEAEFMPGPGMGMMGMMGMPGMMGMGAPFSPFGYGAASSQLNSGLSNNEDELQHAGAAAKFGALKALQVQLYMAGADVQKSYWMNKVVVASLPPQLQMFKLYKSYLNTMALSIAYQFQDAFTQEAFLDDFNDRYGSLTGTSSEFSEAIAEQQTYSLWSQLAMIKYQLLMINLYEKNIFGQLFAAMQPPHASSYLEVDAQFVSPNDPSAYYGYIGYYQMYLRYYAIMLEVQLAQTGLTVANARVALIKGSSAVGVSEAQTEKLAWEQLPQMFMQWASVNQQKYYLDYYTLMMDMYNPQLAAAVAADRADNAFQYLVQTDAPVTTAEATTSESPAQ